MNNPIRLFRDAATDAAGGLGSLTSVGIGLGVAQSAWGIYQGIQAKKEMKKLLKQRKAYQTPEEIFQILQATQSRAQQGFDPTTLSYLTNQTDQAFSSSLGASMRLGGDPNALSGLFQEKINSIMKIGAENHNLNMKNWSQWVGALNNLGESKAAEWQSEQDILKDKMQAAGTNMQAATGNVSGGINTLLSTLSADQIARLYGGGGNGTRAQRMEINKVLPGASFWGSDGMGFNSSGRATGVFQ